MRALFNGTCDRCGHFLPRCAVVRLYRSAPWDGGKRAVILCRTCRRQEKGKYQLHPGHR